MLSSTEKVTIKKPREYLRMVNMLNKVQFQLQWEALIEQARIHCSATSIHLLSARTLTVTRMPTLWRKSEASLLPKRRLEKMVRKLLKRAKYSISTSVLLLHSPSSDKALSEKLVIHELKSLSGELLFARSIHCEDVISASSLPT